MQSETFQIEDIYILIFNYAISGDDISGKSSNFPSILSYYFLENNSQWTCYGLKVKCHPHANVFEHISQMVALIWQATEPAGSGACLVEVSTRRTLTVRAQPYICLPSASDSSKCKQATPKLNFSFLWLFLPCILSWDEKGDGYRT